MFGDRVVCAAADLVRAAHCEFALLRALDTELGTLAPGVGGDAPDIASADAARDARSPSNHGQADSLTPGSPEVRAHLLAEFRARFGTEVVEIRHTEIATPETLTAAHAETVAALRAGAPVVRGPVFVDGDFVSSCDFLVRADHRVRYTAHGVGPDEVALGLELAACAEEVDRCGGLSAPVVRVHGDVTGSDRPLAQLIPVYRARRRRLARVVEDKLGELLPVQWGDPRFLACGRCPVCVDAFTTARDLLLVAGLRNPARARLREAGIATIDRLATTASPVAGLAPRTVTALRRQAEVQVRGEHSGAPRYTLADPIALGALPPPSPGDLSLILADIPGRPLRLEIGAPEAVRRAVGPSGPAATRAAVLSALEYLAARRREHPEMRVYYYTSAVRDTLLSCTGRYGVGEEIAEDLLREGILVDLYPIVRTALLIGTRSYDLPALREILPGAAVSGAERDCVTILRLRDWLLGLATDQRVAHGALALTGARSWCRVPEPGAAEAIPPARPSSIEAALAEFATSEAPSAVPAAMMAAALGYHRRERQPLWWAHADRLRYPVDEWADAPGVLVADWGTVDTKWHHSPNRPTMRRYITLTGRIGAGRGGATTLAPGTTVHTFYDRPLTPGMVGAVGRRATATAVVLGCSVDPDFDDTVRLEESLPAGCDPYDDLPIAIAPGLPRREEATERAVEYAAQRLLVTLPEVPDGAIFDILAREPPRLHGGKALPEVHGDHAAAIAAALEDLDDSYVAVQGPPGTGKTATAARVIERLVSRRKWRIGVVALAHPTIENILDAIVEIGILPELVAKKDVGAVAPEWAVIDADRYPRFLANAVNGCVIGGAPADFADEELIPRGALDLLVIADAGYFPLAELIAVGSSARNLLLLGDPAGTRARADHPAPVGESALGRLVDGRGTLPADRGYFLDRTWRMHPRICERLSRLRYDGRLRSNETVTLARRLDEVPPGIDTVLVDHLGNTTESEAEAREVVRRVRALLGANWTVGAHTRRLHPHDLFVMAPYGAQVTRIRTLLARAKIEDVLVGTPDRFRGREAAVVLVSMATSTPAEAPYGMSPLLAGDLIHAAVGRALWKVLVIRSTLLTEYLPPTRREVAELAGFLELTAGPDQPKQTPSPR